MKIRLSFLLSCLLSPICCAMDTQLQEADAQKPAHILTHQLCREYTVWKDWARRTTIVQSMLKNHEKFMTQSIAEHPLAPEKLQVLWHQAQLLIGIPIDQQNPLYVVDDLMPLPFFTMYTITSIYPPALDEYEQQRAAYGYMRYTLIHEAGHIKLGNSRRVLNEGLVIMATNMKETQLLMLFFILSRYDLFPLSFALHYKRSAGQEQVLEQLGTESESTTDALALKTMDCQLCLEETIAHIVASGSDSFRDAMMGYASVESMQARALELAGKRCTWHAAAATGH